MIHEPKNSRASRILIAEDDITLAKDLSRSLEDLGYEVAGTVSLGESAVQQAREVDPDLILMDVKLAGAIDGIEAAEQICARLGIPVVYLTGYTEEEPLERAKKIPCYGYLAKSANSLELRTTIDAALYKHTSDKLVRESEERFRRFSMAAFEAIIIHEGGILLGANDQYYEMFGYRPEELLGKQALPLTAAPEAIEFLRRQIATGGVGPYESIGLKKDGTKFPMEIRAREWEYEGRKVRVAAITDITERKQAEEALRESEERYKSIFELVPTSIVMLDSDGIIVDVNPNHVSQIGGGKVTREDYIGMNVLTHPSIVKAGLSEMYKQVLEGKPIDEEDLYYPSVTRGSHGYFNVRGVPLRKDEEVIGAILIHDDITERKRTEETLRHNEARLSNAAKIAKLGYWEYEVPDDLIILNDRFYSILRTSAEQAGGYEMSIDRYARLFLYPDDIPVVTAEMKKAFETTDPHVSGQIEHRVIYGDGEIGHISVRYFIVKDDQGRTVKIHGVMQDITERKRAEEMLQRYNQRLMILRDIDRDIVMARSPKAIADTVLKHIRRLIPCWRANVALYEPDTAEIVILVSEANADRRIQPGLLFPAPSGWVSRMLTEGYDLIEDTHKLGEPTTPIVELTIAGGTRSVLSASLVVEGNLIGALVLARRTPAAFAAEDIEIACEVADQLAIAIHQARLKEQVERYSAELEKRVAQRTAQLESANKDLESFTYSVSHDLRAPLRAISGFAAIVARRHRADLNEEGQHYVDNIVLASERMGHLIDDLLRYSRLGRSSMRRERVPLREVFDPLASDLAARLAEIGGTLSIADDLPTVVADRTLLSQVFANLLENAITYRQPDVPVQVTISCQTEDKDIIVCVGDNGIGIPSEHCEKIFNIFQRLHSDDEYPGTGIGLGTVKKSTELLGGQVWVESVVGEGSKFFVKLPRG